MKKNLAAILAILIVMVCLPWGAVLFASHDAGMAICFVLFFGVNAMFSLYVGIFSGLAVKQRWYLPLVNSAVFLLGVWTAFDWGNRDFYGYAIAYLGIAFVAMLTSIIVVRNIRKELNNTSES